MCLTIPKKVVEIEGDDILIESISGDRQKVKTVISLEIGDFVLLKQGIIFEKMSAENAAEITKILKGDCI